MLSSTSVKHDLPTRWNVSHNSSLKHLDVDYRGLLIRKMSELNTSANNHQLAAGLKVYENFCINDSTMPINPAKQLPQLPVQLKGRNMNGEDSPLSPSSPTSWTDPHQTVQSLLLELEERKRNEAQLHHLVRALRQQQLPLHRDFDQVNGLSLTPDGLPAAPASDGIVENVKDGHIRRLGREITVLKANLHDTENKLGIAQKERDSAFQQVASLSSLLADSERRVTILQHQMSEMQVSATGDGEKMSSVHEKLETQKAEISTLKESVQRLSRENQCLKESAAMMSSRQPTSLGNNSSGGSSVAGCSQELDYLHKVVDTLKVTVQEQHAKLCSLRSLHDKTSQASSTVAAPIKAQSFPIATGPRPLPASLASAALRPKERPSTTPDNAEWSVDGSGLPLDNLLRTGAPAAATKINNATMGMGNNMAVSSRAHQAVQDDETLNALDSTIEKWKLGDSKPTTGVEGAEKVAAGSKTAENPGYFLVAENNFNLTSPSKPLDPSSDNSVSGGLNAPVKKVSAAKPISQLLASHRPNIPASTVLTSSGSRPLSKSEVIGVNSGLGRTSIDRRSISQYVTPGALSRDLAVEPLQTVRTTPNPQLPPNAMSTSVVGSVSTSDLAVPQLPLRPRMVGGGVLTAAPQFPRPAQPQFVYEAEIEDTPVDFPGKGKPNYLHQQLVNRQHKQILRAAVQSSSGFTPQPPPSPHQARAPSSSSSPLASYQTASTAITSEGVHVLNKHMMGGGNVIYTQTSSQFLPPQQQQMLPEGGAILTPSSQLVNFPSQTLRSRGSEQPQHQQPLQQIPFTTNLSPPLDNQAQTLYTNTTQQLDPSGPRVNSDRTCPVCSQDFSHVPMEDFQAHVYECFDEAGPETMKAPGEDKPSSGGSARGGVTDRTCPLCNVGFESSVPQSEFERHVHSHFGEEGFEIVS